MSTDRAADLDAAFTAATQLCCAQGDWAQQVARTSTTLEELVQAQEATRAWVLATERALSTGHALALEELGLAGPQNQERAYAFLHEVTQ